jgi:hypothetical protein
MYPPFKGVLLANHLEAPLEVGNLTISYSYNDLNGCYGFTNLSVEVVDSTATCPLYYFYLQPQPYVLGDPWEAWSYVSSIYNRQTGEMLKPPFPGQLTTTPPPEQPGINWVSYYYEDENACVASTDGEVAALCPGYRFNFVPNYPTYRLGDQWIPEDFVVSLSSRSGTVIYPPFGSRLTTDPAPVMTGLQPINFIYEDNFGCQSSGKILVQVVV